MLTISFGKLKHEHEVLKTRHVKKNALGMMKQHLNTQPRLLKQAQPPVSWQKHKVKAALKYVHTVLE